MTEEGVNEIRTLFPRALAGNISPDDIGPVILTYLLRKRIIDDEEEILMADRDFIIIVDRDLRGLQRRLNEKGRVAPLRDLVGTAKSWISDTKDRFGEEEAKAFKERIMDDLDLTTEQLEN